MKRSDSIAVAAIRQVALLLGVLAVIWGAIGFHLRLEYQHALRNAETRTVSLARSFEATAGRSIAILDQTLEHVRDLYLRDPDHFTLRDWLRDKPVSHGINARFAVADATGLIVASTTADAPSNVNIADQDCFRAQVEATRDELFIGQPVIGRVSDQLSVPFTRRMTTPDGRFAGVVIASLDPGSTGVFDVSDSAGEGFMMLIGRDGIIRAAWPDTAKVGGSVLPATNPEMARMAEATSSSDGAETAVSQEAIASYRAVAGYPVFVAAGVASRAAFAPYARARLDGVLAGALLSLVVMVVGWTLFQRRQRLARSHRDLTLALENVSQGILMIDPNRRVPVT